MANIDFSAAVKTTPRRNSPRTKTAAPTPVVETRSIQEQRVEGVQALGQMAQLGLVMAGQMADAGAVGRYWPSVSSEVVKLAETNTVAAQGVDLLLKVGPYTGLAMALMPLVAQIAANHRLVKAAGLTGLGVVAPEVLEAQMRADVMRAQMEAKQLEREMIREAQEYEAMVAAEMAESQKKAE